MRKAIAFLTIFVMSVSLFAQTDVAKYGDKGAPEVRIPQTWNSNNNRTEDFLLVLADSWGDGWNGGANLDVSVNGTLVYDGIFCAASTEEFTLAVDEGDIVQTAFTSGSYDNEITYAFYDNNGTLVASDGPSPGAGITFTVSIVIPAPAVFFSEYAEGSSNNKYLEVYNGTDATISLDDFVILGNYNGNPWSETFTFVTGATIESGGVYVIANSSASDAIQALADELLAYGDPWYTVAFNGDDVRALALVDGTILDIIGTLDGDGDGTSGEGSEDDPGGGFDVAGVSEATKDYTLVRKDGVVEGNGGDWASSAGTTTEDSEYIVEEKPTADYTPGTLGWHINAPCAGTLLSINMYDAYGDGWNGNYLHIGWDSLTIENGASASVELCLYDAYYPITCGGGTWMSEVSWEIVNTAGEVVLAGGAPYEGFVDGNLIVGEDTYIVGCMDANASNFDATANVDYGCSYAGSTCSLAFAATPGANEAPFAPSWYTFTASLTGTATISSVGGGVDTQVYGYSGTCDALTEVGFGDDEGGSPEWSSIMELDVVAGESYYIFWTDYWSALGFVWTLEEALPPTSPENLTAEAGAESVFLEWDGAMPTPNRSVANNNRGISIEDANARHLAKMTERKGNEPSEVHRFAVVNPDYASNSRSTDVIIACGGGDWMSEVSWEILDDAGTIVVQGGAPVSDITASLDNGVYTVNGYDSYGDGWQNNLLTVTGTDGTQWLSYTLLEGASGTTTFTMSDTPPELANLTISNTHYDADADAIMITINNTGGVTAFDFFVTYYNSNVTSDVCQNGDYDSWGSVGSLEADSSLTYVVLGDASYWMGYGIQDIGAFIDWGCTVSESDETDNTITTTIEILDPFDGVTWNVYRSEAGAAFASVGVAESMDHLDESLTGDVEYCYYVTQVDMEGAAESDSSNYACATPIVAVDLPIPTGLTAEADGWNVMVNWMSPDLTGFGTMSYTPSSGEKEDDVSTYIAYDPSDYPTPVRQGGEDIANAVAIDALPYNNTGTTEGYTDDYDETCPYSGSTSPDVVYSFTPTESTVLDISTCGEGTGYDTKLYVYENEAGTLAATLDGGEASACSDDDCENSTTGYLSFIPGVLCEQGNTYYIVVDGYGGAFGAYEIDVTETVLPSPVMGYGVYRGGEFVGWTDHVDSTSFEEFITEEGDYAYYATAYYDVYGESDPSNSETVTVGAPAPTCNAPENLVAVANSNDVSLSWDAPAGGASWFGYNDGVLSTALGANAPVQFTVAARFGQEELADYNGMSLSSIRFIHYEPAASYQVVVWMGEPGWEGSPGGNPVLVDTSDWMSGADIPAYEWFEYELDESITIDWTQDLLFGYNIDTPTGWPAAMDAGPAVAGSSDLIQWPTGSGFFATSLWGFNNNWMIDGFADYSDGRSISSMAPIAVEYQNPTTTSEPVEHRLPTPIVVNTPDERNITNYIVYRDNEEVDTLGIGETMYNDMDVEWGAHTYHVTALYNNIVDCSESDPSNQVAVDLLNNPPPAVTLLQPDDGLTIIVSESNSGDDFPFIWTAVNDEDNDPVMYVVSATDEMGAMTDTSMAGAGWFPTIGELAAPLLQDSVGVMTYSWNVLASDPWDSTASSNGPRSLTIDVSGLLALDGIGLPDVFALHNNYPNPFNPVTNITYDIPEVAQVTLDIYNVSGQKVRTLAQGHHEPGRYRIQWNATNDYGNQLSSGMYIYRIHAGDFVSVKKLILMK